MNTEIALAQNEVLQIMLAGGDLLGINQSDPRNYVTDGNLTLLQHYLTTSYSHFKQPFGCESLKKNANSHSCSWLKLNCHPMENSITKSH